MFMIILNRLNFSTYLQQRKKHNFISLCPFFIYGIRENSSSVPAKGKKSKNVKSEGAHHVPHRKFQLSYGILIM